MKNSIRIFIYSLLVLAIASCAGSKPASERSAPVKKDYSNFTNMYDVLSTVGGINLRASLKAQ